MERRRSRAGGSSSTISTRRLIDAALTVSRERKAQRHDVFLVEAPGLHRGPLAIHELEPFLDVGQRQPIAVAHGEIGGGHRVADDNGDHALVEFAGDRHRAAVGPRLDAVIDGVLEQGLQRESGHQRIGGQRIHLPVDAQPVTEAQLLHALIGARHVDLLGQRDLVALLVEVGAEQIGEILHGFLGARRVAARERGDGVHAVEQEVRADARLQRVHARLRLQLDVVAPLVRHVEIAQRQRGHDEGDAGVAHQERPGVVGNSALSSQPKPPALPKYQASQEITVTSATVMPSTIAEPMATRLAIQVVAQHAEQAGAAQADPQQEHRGEPEVAARNRAPPSLRASASTSAVSSQIITMASTARRRAEIG